MACDGLLLIDLQNGMFDGAGLPSVWRAQELRRTVVELLTAAREASVPVCFVRHLGGPDHPLEEGTVGSELHPDFTPRPGELLVDKRTPDAFYETGLDRLLEAARVTAPAIVGIQSEYCVDTTCRRAFSLGYKVTLAEDGHSTWDSTHLSAEQVVRHHNELLGGWFADVRPAAEIEFRRDALARQRR